LISEPTTSAEWWTWVGTYPGGEENSFILETRGGQKPLWLVLSPIPLDEQQLAQPDLSLPHTRERHDRGGKIDVSIAQLPHGRITYASIVDSAGRAPQRVELKMRPLPWAISADSVLHLQPDPAGFTALVGVSDRWLRKIALSLAPALRHYDWGSYFFQKYTLAAKTDDRWLFAHKESVTEAGKVVPFAAIEVKVCDTLSYVPACGCGIERGDFDAMAPYMKVHESELDFLG
jgi:hypothetical protein